MLEIEVQSNTAAFVLSEKINIQLPICGFSMSHNLGWIEEWKGALTGTIKDFIFEVTTCMCPVTQFNCFCLNKPVYYLLCC